MDSELRVRTTAAIQSGDFALFRVVMDEYSRDITARIRSEKNRAERERVYRDSLEFLEECLHLARVMRSHIAARLHVNTSTSHYRYERDGVSTWRAEA